MSYVYPQSDFTRSSKKVVLEENVYARLLGLINITGFSRNMTSKQEADAGYEYGGFLYGKTDEEGNIVLSEVNEQSDYTPQDGRYKASNNMIYEMITKLQSPKYNCVVHVHTHPYGKTESSRFFSQADIDYYKNHFKDVSKVLKKEITILGCSLTISSDFIPENDDISLVYYDREQDRMYYLPNIYVRSRENGKLYPLKTLQELLYIDKNGRLYNERQMKENNVNNYTTRNIERTYIVTEEEFGKKM